MQIPQVSPPESIGQFTVCHAVGQVAVYFYGLECTHTGVGKSGQILQQLQIGKKFR